MTEYDAETTYSLARQHLIPMQAMAGVPTVEQGKMTRLAALLQPANVCA